MASTYLYRTQVAGTSTQKMTFSAWVKRGQLGSYEGLLNCYQSDASRNAIYFQPIDTLAVYFKTSSSTHIYYETNRKFRDVNGWYHIVVRIDTTQGNATHRCRIYINGEEETSFSSSSGGSQNASFSCINQNNLDLEVGRMQYGSTVTAYYTGSMSHVHFLDGEDRTPDYFGSTDSTTGEWKIINEPTGITYGNNGFFILKNDNSNLDRSGEGHNQTIGGTLTKSEDNPSNVFCTMNPLVAQSGFSFSQGNNTITWSTDNKSTSGTLAMVTGKYYWEMKFSDATGGSNAMIGVGSNNFNHDTYVGATAGGWSYYAQGGTTYNSNSYLSYGSGFTAGDIIGVAFNADTRTIWFSKNGTWQNSATISEIGSGTTTNSAYTGMGSAGDVFFPVISAYNGNVCQFNFGNGYFGTTAVSSAGTNASGNGIFEYDVPTGYTALSTKGLNL